MIQRKTEFQIEIINKLKELRHSGNISQAQICEIIGINSLGQIGNIESPRFKHKYTLKQIYLLANYFKYPFEKIFLTDLELEKSKDEVINILILKLIAYEN